MATRRTSTAKPSTGARRSAAGADLWVEGDDKGDFIRLGERALRVRTDDDEVDLAYYFVDDDAAAASPDRLVFLLHDTWPLPADAGGSETVFSHSVPVRTVRLAARHGLHLLGPPVLAVA
ncbi:hypothetical protein ACX27O_25475 [Micromonospora sp. SD19]